MRQERNDEMKLRITTPEGVYFEEEIEGFHLETHKGERTILNDHINYLCFFEYTPLLILDEKGGDTIYIYSGYAQIIDNQAVIICQRANNNDFINKIFERGES